MSLARRLEPFSQERPRLLIVEGDDDQHVVFHLGQHLQLAGIEIRQTEGTGNLRDYLDVLPTISNYHALETVAVVWDVDTDSEQAFRTVCRELGRHYDALPDASGTFAGGKPRVGALVLTLNTTGATLEDLCLASASDPTPLECVEEYLDCLRQRKIALHPNLSKHRAHAYLAALAKDPSHNLGQAAHAGVWNFDHPAWEEIKNFLRSM